MKTWLKSKNDYQVILSFLNHFDCNGVKKEGRKTYLCFQSR